MGWSGSQNSLPKQVYATKTKSLTKGTTEQDLKTGHKDVTKQILF